MINTQQNNRVILHGQLIGPLQFSHRVYNDCFYTLNLKCKRLSGIYDIIPITVTKSIIDNISINENAYYLIKGQIRSYNRLMENKNKLIVTVYVKSLQISSQLEKEGLNSVHLEGYICKQPNYRKTPFLREICDILLAVNRAHGKSDYIPIIAWGQSARSVSSYPVGQRVKIVGRFQSREYTKHMSNGNVRQKTAYEISAMKVERADSRFYD